MVGSDSTLMKPGMQVIVLGGMKILPVVILHPHETHCRTTIFQAISDKQYWDLKLRRPNPCPCGGTNLISVDSGFWMSKEFK